MSGNGVSNSLPSYLFGMENSHSPYPSPRHSSARSHSARSRKRALSLSPLSDGIGIDFNTIIRTSPTSLVAYINGSRASPANMSPQPEVYGHFLGVRGSCIPQPCSMPSSQKGVRVASSGPALPAYGEDGALEYERMQQLEHGGLQPSLVNNMVVQHGLPDPEGQPAGLLKTERLDDFPGGTLDLPPAPPLPPLPPTPQGPPPPYHAHPHLHHPELIHHAQPLALTQAALDEDGEMDDIGSKHCCRWIDCSALYDQQEELVRHIEKIHIDQRKGEDFTCFWAGCPRRYKPFNARYKLLIHMRVHSGEKPNKCSVSLLKPMGVHWRCMWFSKCNRKSEGLFSWSLNAGGLGVHEIWLFFSLRKGKVSLLISGWGIPSFLDSLLHVYMSEGGSSATLSKILENWFPLDTNLKLLKCAGQRNTHCTTSKL